jgi:hypothetical protein
MHATSVSTPLDIESATANTHWATALSIRACGAGQQRREIRRGDGRRHHVAWLIRDSEILSRRRQSDPLRGTDLDAGIAVERAQIA